MLTAQLEKLILEGRASYNTFVAGGTQKHVLNVYKDRFIIITDLTYYSCANLERTRTASRANINVFLAESLNTQVKIFSTKSQNGFIFRNNVQMIPTGRQDEFWVLPFGSVKLDTYLVHESDVSFTFSYAGERRSVLNGVTKAQSIAFAPPFDYGKDGQPGALPVELVTGDPLGDLNSANGGQLEVTQINKTNLELAFPITATTALDHFQKSESYPILQIGYVEILGAPNNISGTL